MIIANPFTGAALNANPEGHNQYVNPDGPSRKTITTKSGNVYPADEAVRYRKPEFRSKVRRIWQKVNDLEKAEARKDQYAGGVEGIRRSQRRFDRLEKARMKVGRALSRVKDYEIWDESLKEHDKYLDELN
mgnify:CR=1 FL=1